MDHCYWFSGCLDQRVIFLLNSCFLNHHSCAYFIMAKQVRRLYEVV